MAAEKLVLPPEQNLANNRKNDYGSSLRQVTATFIANLGAINTGMMMGFSAVTMPQLLSENSSLTLTKEQTSWFASLASIGTPCGCILSAYITDVLGRKRTLIYTEIPAIVGWIVIAVSPTVEWIYIGRILTGISAGMIGAPARVYTAEVTQPHLRGILAALASVGTSFGVTLEYVIGPFCNWRELAWISCVLPVLSICGCFLLPESPSWLVSSGQKEKCFYNLKKLRGSTCNVEHEVAALVEFSERHQSSAVRLSMTEQFKMMVKPSVRKPFFILASYFFIYQMSGCSPTTFYAVTIFEDFGAGDKKYFLTLLTGIIRLLFTILGCFLMLHCRRRTLTFISATGCGVTMFILAIYGLSSLNSKSGGQSSLSWIPHFSIFLYTAMSTIGYLIIPWVMIGELYPAKVRGLAGGLTTAFNYISTFLAVKTFPLLRDWQPTSGPYFLYGIISMLGLLFFYVFLPETKDKSLQEIEEHLSNSAMMKRQKKHNQVKAQSVLK